VPTLDSPDIALVAALQRAPRASFATLAEVLDAAPSTISRRYARLVGEHLLHVTISIPWSAMQSDHPSALLLSCRPGTSPGVASDVARLEGVQSVFLVAGSSDVHAIVHPTGDIATTLLEDVPAIDGVESTSTGLILGTASRAGDWAIEDVLTPAQVDRLRAPTSSSVDPPAALRPIERRLLNALIQDGRLSIQDAAQHLGVTRTTASRLLSSLVDSGFARPRVDIEPALLGYPLGLFASITSHPAHAEATLSRLAEHPAVRFSALVTGEATILAQVALRDERSAREFLTADIGSFEGVQSVSTSTLLRTVRRNWHDIDPDGRLGPSSQSV
jgi:DNA-binding Lrp family transcriptional regulator